MPGRRRVRSPLSLPADGPAADSQPGRLRFAALGYALTVLLTGTNLATPLYAGYERAFGLSPLGVTLLVAVYAAAVVVALLVCGPLSDTAGYRPVLVAGLAAAACGSALLAAAPGPGWLFAGRAVQGLAAGTCSGALTAGLVLTEPRGRRARASFLAATATTAACGFGPVLAGALAQYAPAPRALSYLVEIGLLAWAVAYVVLALVPSYAAAALGGRNLLLVAAAAQAAFRSWDPARAMEAGLAGLAAGLLVLIAAGLAGSVPVLFAAMAVAGCGQGLAFMGGVRRINEIAPPGARAGTVSMFYVVTYAGSGLVTVGVGLLATFYVVTYAGSGLVTVGVGLLATFYVVTYAGSGLVTVGVGLLATLAGLTASVRWAPAALAAGCLLTLAGLLRHRTGCLLASCCYLHAPGSAPGGERWADAGCAGVRSRP